MVRFFVFFSVTVTPLNDKGYALDPLVIRQKHHVV